MGGCFKNHIPTPATITTIRSATRNELFAVEMDCPISTAAGMNNDTCLIYEHLLSFLLFLALEPGFQDIFQGWLANFLKLIPHSLGWQLDLHDAGQVDRGADHHQVGA